MVPPLHRPVPHALNDANPFGQPDPAYSALGYRGHPGCDLLSPAGTPCECCDDGEVVYSALAGTAGLMVKVRHSWGFTRYLHLSGRERFLGDAVAKGEVLGYTGGEPGTYGAGLTFGAHLHLDCYPDGEPFDNGYGGRVDASLYFDDVAPPEIIGPGEETAMHRTPEQQDYIDRLRGFGAELAKVRAPSKKRRGELAQQLWEIAQHLDAEEFP